MAFDYNRPVSTAVAELVSRVDAYTALGALSLTTALQSGTAVSGWILGATKGSVITSNIPGITVNSAARSYSGTPTGGAQTIANGLVETLGASANSPKSTSISVAAAAATPTPTPTATLGGLSLDSTTATVGSAKTINIVGATSGSAITGTVPDGMTLNSAARTITGTPTTAGTFSFNLTETLSGATGSPKATNVTIVVSASGANTQPLTTMPMPANGAILLDIDPNTLTSVANGARVTSYTDPTSGIVVAAPVNGPVLNKNMRNGKAGFQFANKDDRLVIPSKATASLAPLYTASSTWPDTGDTRTNPDGNGWSAIIIINNPTGSGAYFPVISTDFTNFAVHANADTIAGMSVSNWAGLGGTANDMHCIVLSGEGNTGGNGRMYVNGELVSFSGVLNSAYDLILGAMFNSQNTGFNASFAGGILRAIFFKGAFSPAKALQAYLWACSDYAKTSPLAGKTNFFIFDGDSITAGTGVGGAGAYLNTSTSGVIAKTRSWPLGSWGNVGKPSQQSFNASSPGNDNIGASKRDVDEYRTVLGTAMNIHVIFGEYYNYPQSTAAANRTYASTVKARGKVNKLFAWTSTDSDRRGAGNDSFNADFMANKGVFDDVWPIHTEPNIGVSGTFDKTRTSPPPVTGDNIHPNALGYQYFAAYIGARMTEAGYAN